MKKLTPNNMNESEGSACPSPTATSGPAPSSNSGPTLNSEPRTANAPDEAFISKDELARRLRVGVRTIERWQHCGRIPYIKCGRIVYFNWHAVVAHLDNQSRVCPMPA